jgi:hypothetical protein
VVRKPGSRAKFRVELLRKLPFLAEVVFCDGRDIVRPEMENPFAAETARPDLVRFVSILARAGRVRPSTSITLPRGEEWFLRIVGRQNRFVFGVYRRLMKTIGYLGQIDKAFGAPATTRIWNTIISIVKILKAQKKAADSPDGTISKFR